MLRDTAHRQRNRGGKQLRKKRRGSLRIPGDADQRSELMSITIPK
jgi:hypothetical protein